MLSTFCITFRENAIMISVILQTDWFLPECCQSHPCSVISSSACCNQAGPPGIKRGGCPASAEVALRSYSHSLPFVLILSFCYRVLGNEWDSEGWQDQQQLIYNFFFLFFSFLLHHFFFVGRICRQQITVLWGAVIS